MIKRKASPFLVCALLLLALSVTAYAKDSFAITYKTGTSDTVTNMPANDSGVGDQAYTVSSIVPEREGYDFLGWELDYEGGTATYKYTVHHLDADLFIKLAEDEVYQIDELKEVTAHSKIVLSGLYEEYRQLGYTVLHYGQYLQEKSDFLLPGAEYKRNKGQYDMTVTLTEDDQHIYFFYRKTGSNL